MYHYCIGEPEDSERPQWQRADAEDMAQVRARALARRKEYRWYDVQQTWCCSFCPAYDVTGRIAMAAHLEERCVRSRLISYMRPDVCADLLRVVGLRHGIADPEQAERDGVIYLHPSEGLSVGNDRSIRLDPRAELPSVDQTENSAGQ